jgi:hypothetical protein
LQDTAHVSENLFPSQGVVFKPSPMMLEVSHFFPVHVIGPSGATKLAPWPHL